MVQTANPKRIGLIARAQIIGELEEKVKKTNGCFFVGFNKVLSPAVSSLRSRLRLQNASVFVAKNTLVKKAFEQAGLSDLEGLLQGETGVIVSNNEDVVQICKILSEFSTENEAFAIRGGFIKDKKLSAKDIASMAKLPGKEQLLGHAVCAIAAPLSGFVNSLSQIIQKFLWTLEEVKKQKSK